MRLRLRGGSRPVAFICCLLCIEGGWVSEGQEKEPEAVEYPFNPKEFPKGWFGCSAQVGADINATWHVKREQDAKDGELICLGKPDGYIRTDKTYENYELGLEWKYPSDPNGNSGILIHTSDKDMIWPKSFQVQLHVPTAGSVFPHDGAKSDNALAKKDLSRPANEWNSCVITCDRGKISLVMNGQKVGEVTGCSPHKGSIGLQSEGSEIHFRKIWLKPLK